MKKSSLVNTKTIATEYGRSNAAIMRWARERIIPSIRLGWRTRLYDPESVRAALLKRMTPAKFPKNSPQQ
jgi:hypothetical protein